MSLLEDASYWTLRWQKSKCKCYQQWTSNELLLDEIKASIKRSVNTPSTTITLRKEVPSFRLMELPIEIRIMVYRQHFHQPRDAFKGSESCPAGNVCPYSIFNANVPVGKLIMASKSVYNEAMPIYLGDKEFKCSDFAYVRRFLTYLGPIQRNYITHISFDFFLQKHGVHTTCQLLSQCTRLRRLEFSHQEQHSLNDNTIRRSNIEALIDCLSKHYRITRHDSLPFTFQTLSPLDKIIETKTTLDLAKKYSAAHKQGVPNKESVTGLVRTDFSRPGPKTRRSSYVPPEKSLWQSYLGLQPGICDDWGNDIYSHQTPRIYNNFT